MSKPLRIIGIGGTNGSGKDTLAQMIADDQGWYFVSVSEDILIPALQAQGLPAEREQMAALGTKWRKEFGMGVNVDKAIELFRSKANDYTGLVIASLRHPGEADRVHELDGQVVWIDADPKVRYDRIYKRGQGAKDQKSFEQFLAEEQNEMHHAGHRATLSMRGVKEKADIVIENNGDSLTSLKLQISNLNKIP